MIQLVTLMFLSLILVNCQSMGNETLMNDSEILAFHHSILTIDTHVDTPLRLKYEGIDLGQRYNPREIKSKLDFPRMQEGGLDAAFFAVWTPQGIRNDSGHAAIKQKALDIIDLVEEKLAGFPDQAQLALTAADAGALASDHKYAIYLGMENGYPLGTDLDNLDLFYKRGIRYVTLCHTKNNDICDSSTDDAEYDGLSPYGYQVVRRMNELGMLVDVSHASDATVYDVLNHTSAPVIASHSCARALCDHPRNINDALITRIAAGGGVIQMCLYSEYVVSDQPNPDRDSARAALKEKWGDSYELQGEQKLQYRAEKNEMDRKHPQILPSVADLVNHIDHIVALVGIDHVGIGTDFDGGAGLSDCFDVSELPNITRELFKRGYSKADVIKIWSGNLLRVFQDVERLSHSKTTG